MHRHFLALSLAVFVVTDCGNMGAPLADRTGDPLVDRTTVETNQQACERAVRATFAVLACFSPDSSVTQEEFNADVQSFVDARCTNLPDTEDCDFRPLADCIDNISCEDLSAFDETMPDFCMEALSSVEGCPAGDFLGQPTPVVGPGLSGNDPPTLQITEPTVDVTVDQGANFLIRWVDSDPDNNALISFSMVNTETNQAILLVQGVAENDSIGPDTFTVSTSLIPVGTYNLGGTINDGVNAVVTIFSETTSVNITQRTVIRIVEPGSGQQTVSPVE